MKLSLAILLTSSLLIWPIKVRAASPQPLPPSIVLIQKNQPAAYDGVLMPVETLRNLETKSLNSDLYKAELTKNQQIIPLYSAPDHSALVLIGVGGLLLGFVIGFVAH